MYAMICTRSDFSYVVSIASIYMTNLGKAHWQAVKWILRYLRGTTSTRLEFGRCKDGVVRYVDSNFVGDLVRRRSLSGYIFSIGGCAVSWKASLQPIVALSTTEAEYIAMTEDSQSAIHLSKDQMFHERTKHIDVKFHFVRDVIGKCTMTVKKIGTEDNPADMGAGDLLSARKEFDEMPERKSVCCWTCLVSGYTQFGLVEDALRLFARMVEENLRPEDDTMVGVISACSKLETGEIEQWVNMFVEFDIWWGNDEQHALFGRVLGPGLFKASDVGFLIRGFLWFNNLKTYLVCSAVLCCRLFGLSSI
uniref:Retrovirus-related Pol polyprotein from transposon TNT 1-94 n=1 Tax=Ananas comosus var. bracteatus TaxID=296719 RepID=A0A6V7Q0E6_ANACO|nr:unnamed protein product [Ananas comosus var. bracteatus]